MINFSRRQLAKYAVDEMSNSRSLANLPARLAAALVVSGRRKEVELLLSDIDQEMEERRLLARALITSSYPLSLSLKRDLASQLKKMTGAKDVVLQEQVDKNVIGGLKVETASRSWDRTIRKILNNVKGAQADG